MRSGGWGYWCEVEQGVVFKFRSHFYVFGITDERMYIANLGDKWERRLVPLMKQEGEFVCTLTGDVVGGAHLRPSRLSCPIRNRGNRL